MKDGFGSHEKARVLNSLADYCGIQKNSLMARIVKKKEVWIVGFQFIPLLKHCPSFILGSQVRIVQCVSE